MERQWQGARCQFKLINNGAQSRTIEEIVLFTGEHKLSPDTQLYGEGYNMLSQYKGTLSKLELVGNYSDRDHYKMPQKAGFFTVYNLICLSDTDCDPILLGFTSCHRFNGEFRFSNTRFEIVLDAEKLELKPGEAWQLEAFTAMEAPNREELFRTFSGQIQLYHPMLPVREIPSGWCSWYAYGPEITEQAIFENIEAIKRKAPQLRYIQIDDGYQARMGDWLTPNPAFAGDVKSLCQKIKREGFEPAIWVAPFIAERDSNLFREHPDWFVKDEQGQPLNSGDYSFGGWRKGPWFMLDGSHPQARAYLKRVFQTMRSEWGCKYFKLDANLWGALHGGVHDDPSATRVEAYRSGMQAILEAVGEDAFVLGCNAPMWPSLGLVHGMRVTDDISREWRIIKLLASQYFNRSWQHNRLWVNDPDCLVLQNSKTALLGPDGNWRVEQSALSRNEFLFHAACILASGGMVLSGDELNRMDDERFAILNKCLQSPHRAASFEDRSWSVGRIEADNQTIYVLFNWEDSDKDMEIELPGKVGLKDYWTDKALGTFEKRYRATIPARSAEIVAANKL